MTSRTASVARRTSGKWTTATVVGRSGVSLIVAVSSTVYESPEILHISNLTLCHDPERPFCANEQLRQVEPSGRLSGPATRLYDFTGRKDDRLTQINCYKNARLKGHNSNPRDLRTTPPSQCHIERRWLFRIQDICLKDRTATHTARTSRTDHPANGSARGGVKLKFEEL